MIKHSNTSTLAHPSAATIACIHEAFQWAFLELLRDPSAGTPSVGSTLRCAVRFAVAAALLPPAAVLAAAALRRFVVARHLRRLLQQRRFVCVPRYSLLCPGRRVGLDGRFL